MKAMQQGKGGRRHGSRLAGIPAAVLALVLLGGCSTSIQTPLPDLGPTASTSLSQEERKKAVDELNEVRATHEQDAERQIEQAR
jgi:hypothetical protein